MLLSIFVHQHYPCENHGYGEEVPQSHLLPEEHDRPEHRPEYRERPVRVGDRKVVALDYLLPEYGIRAQDRHAHPRPEDPPERHGLVPRGELHADARARVDYDAELYQREPQRSKAPLARFIFLVHLKLPFFPAPLLGK